MVSVQWYYGRTGPGQVGEIVSYTTPVQEKLRTEAYRIAGNAKSILSSEPKVRTGDSQITVEQHDLDYHVFLVDPSIGRSNAGAAGIEKHFGVLARSV
ncbi:MAG: DUF5403 family protein [Brevibacterium aurantiacum]|nr:DUF5403 family protein [Brevibacterium aurantiacum]